MSVPLNTTRNKDCSLRSLEIRYPAYWLFWCSSSAPQRSVTAPGAHAHMNTVTCFVQNASPIEAPAQQQWHQVSSSDESLPFPTGAPKGPTHQGCPFPKVQAFYTSGHMEETRDRGQCRCLAWRESPNRSSNREESCMVCSVRFRWWCCQPAGGLLVTQRSHGCRFCGGGHKASELCLQGHIHNCGFGTPSGTDSCPSLILLPPLHPKGWRQETNPQAMVIFSRGNY